MYWGLFFFYEKRYILLYILKQRRRETCLMILVKITHLFFPVRPCFGEKRAVGVVKSVPRLFTNHERNKYRQCHPAFFLKRNWNITQ
jgi:hypothetical protein